jgi:hypothetical protein
MSSLRSVLSASFVGAVVAASGCGSDPAPVAGGGSLGGPVFGADTCTNLCLRQKPCASGVTSLSGVVRDPAGKLPVYNALVYVPNAAVPPIATGASCERCGAVPGEPLAIALTGIDGRFRLENVPVGPDVPLVVQMGKWRRQLTVPSVAECADTAVDEEGTRLPRRKSEGDIPRIALTTGGADTMECWLRKIGLDDSEFTTSAGDGSVHFYTGGTYRDANGLGPLTSAFAPDHQGGGAFTDAPSFWKSEAALKRYDIVILSCEGTTNMANKPPAALAAMKAFADAGGRIFASHWHRYWFNTGAKYDEAGNVNEPAGAPSPFEPFATWNDQPEPCLGECSVDGAIDTSFPKGKAMHDWLAQPGVDALPNGTLPIEEPRHSVDAIDPQRARTWITTTNPRATPPGATAVEYLSFNTPIPAPDDQKCGRVVYSDLHVTTRDDWKPWPGGCQTTDLTPQEKALEFMLFDLSSCIQNDRDVPTAPRPLR